MSIFSSLLPIAASFIPGVGQIAGPALGALMNAGSGGGGAYAAPLAGALTSQRIPGQTQAGEYTPPQGGFGTYNYIPTGATQIDPALISQILGLGALNSGAMGTASGINPMLLQSVMNNPYSGMMQGAAGRTGMDLTNIQNLLSGGALGVRQGGQDVLDFARGSIGPTVGNAQRAFAGYEDLLGAALGNPYAPNYISGASNIGQGLTQAGAGIQGTATDALNKASGIAQQSLANPYAGGAQAGANTAGAMGMGAGQTAFGQGGQFGSAAMGGLPAIQSVLNTAFDPQNALYGRALNQTMDQLGTTLARAGITDSGTGAKLMGDTLSNFNIDWQNNQLGRQLSGLQGYTSGMSGLGSQLGQGQQMQAGGAQTYGAGAMLPYQTSQAMSGANMDTLTALANLAKLTAGTVGSAGDLQLGGNAAGYGAYTGDLTSKLGFQDAFTGGANNLAGAYTGALGNLNTGNNAFAGAYNNLGTMGGNIGTIGTAAGMAPYSAYMTNYGDQFGALSNFLSGAGGISNLGTGAIGPMQTYLGGVMTGAGNAANAASGAQSATTNQNAQAAAGLTPMIQSGLSALSRMFRPSGAGSYYPSFALGSA